MSYVQPVIVVQAKSMLVAYLLWFFLGGLGIHKLYLNQPIQFFFYLGLTLMGGALSFIALGWLLLVPLGILLFIDIFLIPGRVRRLNGGF